MNIGFTLPSLHPKHHIQETRILYQELHHCTENRKQAFQTFLEACCYVLTHHTRMAEPIQQSPVCSRRARLVTETGKDRGRKSMKIQTCKNKCATNTKRIASWQELLQVSELTIPQRSYHRLLTGPDRRGGAGPRQSRPPSAAPPPQEAATRNEAPAKDPPVTDWKVQRERGRFSP